MRFKITLFILSILTLNLSAQEKYFKDKSQTQQFSKKISELFQKNKIGEAFKELAPYWPIPQTEIESFEEKTIKYLNLIDDRFGKPIGILKIKDEVIGEIAVRETYLVRYKNSAIRLIFTYYKNDEGWILNAFKWDDSFEEEFK